MEQQQIRIKLSVGTKLLVSGVLLLIAVISFLNISAILLLNDDKKAYIYQSQATEAVLAGREISGTAHRVIELLRLALAAVDPSRSTPSVLESNAFKTIVANQSDVSQVFIDKVNLKTGDSTRLIDGATPAKFDIKPELYRNLLPELLTQSYAFLALSAIGEEPLLGIMFADLKLKERPDGMPVGVGIVRLAGFAKEIKGLDLTIATKTGRVLYDADPSVLYGAKNVVGDPLFEKAVSSQLTTGASEYEVRGEKYLGSYVNVGLNFVVLDKIEYRRAMQAGYALTEKLFYLGTMSVAVAVILLLIFSKTLTAPINRLYDATKEIAKGNFQIDLKATAHDEIGVLTNSFTAMSRQISELIQEREEKVRLDNEMDIVSTVQRTLIPPSQFENERVRIASHYQSASKCGGDWWGFFGVGDRMSLMIADATGHGLPCALMTASARSCMSVMHKIAQEDPEFTFSPAAMLSVANRVVFDAALGEINMTFFIATLDFRQMTMTYSSAGHNPVWIFSKNTGEQAAFTMRSLAIPGPRLGEARDCLDFKEETIPLAEGDVVCFYTDGFLEGKNPNGEMFGKKRMKKAILSALALDGLGSEGGGPDRVVQVMVDEFLKFNTDGKPLDDDVTLAVAQIKGRTLDA